MSKHHRNSDTGHWEKTISEPPPWNGQYRTTGWWLKHVLLAKPHTP